METTISKLTRTLRRTISLVLILTLAFGMASALASEPREQSNPFIEMVDELPVSGGARSSSGQQDSGNDFPGDEYKTARFIVKLREGRVENFEARLGSRLEESIAITDVSIDLAGRLGIHRGEGGTRSTLPVELPVTDNVHSNTRVIILEEPVLPSEFAAELRTLGVERDLIYVQPDFKLKLSSYGETGASQIASGIGRGVAGGALQSFNYGSGNSIPSQSVTIAVVDTGVDTSHPLFNGFLHPITADMGLATTAYSHGTHVAGLALQAALQTGADVKILPIKIFDGTTAFTSDIIAAIQYADSLGAQIINCSFGSTAFNQALYEAIEASDALIVGAAGNGRSSVDISPVFPSCYDLPNVISVTASNTDFGLSFFSNFGQTVDVAYHGRDIWSALPGGKYGSQSGTSMAAAYVSGLAGSILSYQDMSAANLRYHLMYTSDKMTHLQDKVSNGRHINMANAMSGTQGATLTLNPEDDFNIDGWYQRTDTENWQLFSSAHIVQIVARDNRSYALMSDGSLWGWGSNWGQLGDGTTIDQHTPVQIVGLTNVVEVAITQSGGVALKSDGSIWEWTSAYSGYGIPNQVCGIYDAVAISAGENHILALDGSGAVFSWGENYNGQLGYPTWGEPGSPSIIENLSHVEIVAISAGAHSSYFLDSSGDVWSSGATLNGSGQVWWLYPSEIQNLLDYGELPMKDESVNGITAIHAGGDSCVAADGNGDAWLLTLFNPHFWELGQADVLDISSIASAAIYKDQSPTKILVSDTFGDVWFTEQWENTEAFDQIVELNNVASVTLGYEHALALTNNGELWSWGDNSFGQLGDGTTTNSTDPILIVEGLPPGEPAFIVVELSPDTVYIPQSGTLNVYASAAVFDENGVLLPLEEVEWSLDPSNLTGVSIDPATGVITVASTAQADTVTVEATCVSDPGVTGTAELTLDELTGIEVWLSHGSIWIPKVGHNTVIAKAFDKNDNPLTGVQWALDPPNQTGLNLNADGVLTIHTNAVAGPVTITATYQSFQDSAILMLEQPGIVNVTLDPSTIETPDFGVNTGLAKAFDMSGTPLSNEIEWSLISNSPTGIHINQDGEILVNPNAHGGQITVQAIYQGVTGQATLTIERPNEDGTVTDPWKFIRLYTKGLQHEISSCNYNDQKTYVFDVFNPAMIETELSFTLQYGQDVAIGVFEVSPKVTLEKLLRGKQVGPYHWNPDEKGPPLFGFVGWLTTGEHDGDEYTVESIYDCTISPYAAKGYNGPLWDINDPRPNPLPFCPPDEHEHSGVACKGSLNTIKWDGFVTHDTDGTFRIGRKPGGEIEEGWLYAIVIMPLDKRTSTYESYLGIAIDYRLSNGGMLGAGQYFDKYGNIIGDPLDIITGNFTWSYADIEVFGAEPLLWTRTYNAQDKRGDGILGHNWRHSYQFQIVERPLTAQVIFPDGATLTYNKTYSGGFEKPIGTDYELIKTQNGFKLSGKDKTVYEFDNAGNILLYTNSDGLVTTFSYSGNNLTGITNNSGTLTIDYYGNGRIYSVTDGTDKTV